MSRCILVIGPQGSGSSAVAGVLHTLGIHMGTTFLGPSPLNPKGHFEDLEFRNIVEALRNDESQAESLVREYTCKRNERNLWGLKMPQICYLGKYIMPYVDECKIISIDREPKACIKSSLLKYKDKLWEEIEYIHFQIRSNRSNFINQFSLPNLKVDFNLLTDSTEKTVRTIVDFCFENIARPSEETIRTSINFIDPNLNHKREI